MVDIKPRIVAIHALAASMQPARAAFARCWPEATVHDLLDSALLDDSFAGLCAPSDTKRRIAALLRFAIDSAPDQAPTIGIVFTCSAFGAAIEQVRGSCAVPILPPTEAAIVQSLRYGDRLAAIVTTATAIEDLASDFARIKRLIRPGAAIDIRVAPNALAALRSGDMEAHDAAISDTAETFGEADALLLPQFSMSPVRSRLQDEMSIPVITSPEAAVRALRILVAKRAAGISAEHYLVDGIAV